MWSFWRTMHGQCILLLYFFMRVSCVKWPQGTYGLPEAATGCPDIKDETNFKRGWTYHNTEDENPANKRSINYHFAGNFSQHGIQQRFCIKDQKEGNGNWPKGKYCIYKKGECPTDLKEGFVKWDDEHRELDYPNRFAGDLPDGTFDRRSTTLNYCCRDDGDTNVPIDLPREKPFYLLAHGAPQCQKVIGTKNTMEFIKFDDNDRGSENKFGGAHPWGPSEDLFNTKIYYCYYEPGQEDLIDLGTGKQVQGAHKGASSGLGVAIGCGVAGAIVGTASIAFATRRILASRGKGKPDFDMMDIDPQPDPSP